jgi:hypothetical protein
VQLGAYDFRARILWPSLARFDQEDPAGIEAHPNLYEALEARWPMLTDPFGAAVEPGQIVSMEDVIAHLAEATKGCKSTDAECVITTLSAAHGGGAFGIFGTERFVYTERGGWIDLRHLYELAHQQYDHPDSAISIERAGELVEEDQAVVGHPSAFSFEDLPTNHLGVTLGTYLRGSKDAIHAVESFLRGQLAATRSYDDSLPLDGILNFSVRPLLSPHDATLLQSGSWTYKPSGNAYKDKDWLRMMNEGLKKNPERKGVRTSDPNSLVIKEALRIYGPTVFRTLSSQLPF